MTPRIKEPPPELANADKAFHRIGKLVLIAQETTGFTIEVVVLSRGKVIDISFSPTVSLHDARLLSLP
jgi:hypothetical protein